MRGRDDRADGLFSYVRLEERIPADHPLRAVRRLADEALAALNGRFEALYSKPSLAHASIGPSCALAAPEGGRLRWIEQPARVNAALDEFLGSLPH